MQELITFDKGLSLRKRFKAALPDFGDLVAQDLVAVDTQPKTAGHALYLIYRNERTRQNFEEWKWESLDIGQQLVWERTANMIGLKI